MKCPECFGGSWHDCQPCGTCGGESWIAPRLVNLTPHRIVLRLENGHDEVIEPSGTVARVVHADELVEERRDTGVPVPVVPLRTGGQVSGLPDPDMGVAYLVSGAALAALVGKGRYDVYAPATGPTHGPVRGEDGQIIAVTRLVSCV